MSDSPKKGALLSFLSGRGQELDFQAGSRSLKTKDAIDAYLRTPGHLLAILRFFENESRGQVSNATGIAISVLRGYENGELQPSLAHLAVLARHWNGDLRMLLEAFGYVADDASTQSMGLAADFNGTLDTHEKLDLKRLVESFARPDES